MINPTTLPLATLTSVAPVRPVVEQEQVKPITKVEAIGLSTSDNSKAVSTFGQELDKSVQTVGTKLEQQSRSQIEINYNKEAGRQVIKIIDHKTGEVIFQVPSEEVVALAKKLKESGDTSCGSLLDKEC